MRMNMRRFTRLTNALSKNVENNCHALALYLVFYNFCRVHKTLGATLGVSPATVAGVANAVMKMSDADALIDAEAAKVPAARGPYNSVKQRFQLRHYLNCTTNPPASPPGCPKIINRFSTAYPRTCQPAHAHPNGAR
jgi:hypothetical protein